MPGIWTNAVGEDCIPTHVNNLLLLDGSFIFTSHDLTVNLIKNVDKQWLCMEASLEFEN